MTLSPLLERADRASTYFDRRRKPSGNLGGGRWVTVICVGSVIYTQEHLCQADAYAHIGLEGGSPDPHFRPARDETGHVVVAR
jgi:hypothetical protein